MSEITQKVRENLAKIESSKRTRIAKPIGGYVSAKAEFSKADGTKYRTTWEIGVGSCTCTGFAIRHTCRHVEALADAVRNKKAATKKSAPTPNGESK